MENTLYKNTNILKSSGVLNGPITIVYGIGGLVILLIDKSILSKLKINKTLKIILTFIILSISLTIVELVSGYLCHLIFDIDMWNYTNKKHNMGKYICLEYIPIWGLIGTIVVYLLKPFFDKVINKVPKRTTYILIFIFILDLTITIINK